MLWKVSPADDASRPPACSIDAEAHLPPSPLPLRVTIMRMHPVSTGILTLAYVALCLWPEMAHATAAATPDLSQRFWGWWDEILDQLKQPLFWFGMCAQAMFCMRFVWQWIVSEARRHSTIPIAFWYFSLAGGGAMFIYACLRRDPVIMLGQALACLIYIRNLMLIHGQASARKRAGLPQRKLRSTVNGEDDPEEKP